MTDDIDKRIANLRPIPFTKDNQPTSEQKKKGWDRKRQSMAMLGCIDEFLRKPYSEILEIKQDIKKNPQNYTLLEVKLIRYIESEKSTVDLLDRFIGKIRAIEMTSEGNDDCIINITRKIAGKNG